MHSHKGLEVAARKQVSLQAGRTGRFEVARFVADQDAVICIDGEAAEQIGDHSGSRLAPDTDAAVSLDGSVGMIGAIFEGVDMGADGCHFVRHPAVQRVHMAFLVETPGDARLIGDDESEIAGIVDCLNRFPGAFDPLQLAGLEGVARIVIEDAVAIEENRWTPQLLGQFDLGAREILGYADVDEVTTIGCSGHGAGSGQRWKYILLEGGGEAADAGKDAAVDDVDAGIDRTGCPLAPCNEGANPIAVAPAPPKPVAHDVGPQRHVHEARAGARGQIKDVEVEERIAVEQQKALLQPSGGVNQCTGGSERHLLQRHGEAGASPHRTVVARQNAFGLVARQQQDFVKHIVTRDFIDQRVEERPAADGQHRLRRRLRPLAKPGAEAADQNARLSQHRASPTCWRSAAEPPLPQSMILLPATVFAASSGSRRCLILISDMLRLIPERIDANSGIGAEQVTAAGKMRAPRNIRGNQHERHDVAVTMLRRCRFVDAAAVLEQEPSSGLALEYPRGAAIIKAIDELVDASAVEEALLAQPDAERLVLDAERASIDHDVVV